MAREFQSSSYIRPKGLRADSPRSPGRGMGTGKGLGKRTTPSETWLKALEWAKRELPDQHPDFAAAAYVTAKRGGHSPTPQSVLEQLEAQRRDMASLEGL